MKKGNSIKLKIAVIISIIITIFWLLPYIYVICCSFKPGSEVIAVPPSFLPKSFSVENFTQLFVRMNARCFCGFYIREINGEERASMGAM